MKLAAYVGLAAVLGFAILAADAQAGNRRQGKRQTSSNNSGSWQETWSASSNGSDDEPSRRKKRRSKGSTKPWPQSESPPAHSHDSNSPFVWTGTHWERRQVQKPYVATPSGNQGHPWATDSFPVVRDHRTPRPGVPQTSGTVTVTQSPIIRDHRRPIPVKPVTPSWNSSNAPGGVIVTGSPIVRDHRK